MELNPFSNNGLNTINSSGDIVPWTIISPKPYEPLIITTSLNPLSVSNENATPDEDKSDRTIFWIHTDNPTSKWS